MWGVTSFWFWFVFPWWLVMLNTFFLYLLAICVSSFEKSLFGFFIFQIRLFVFLLLSSLSSLCILEEKGATENEMVGWHHRLNGHEFEQTPGAGEGQGSLKCCSPWDRKELDMTERLNWTELNWNRVCQYFLSFHRGPFHSVDCSFCCAEVF